jgi:thiol-disulfide isomerase/thioredoxin
MNRVILSIFICCYANLSFSQTKWIEIEYKDIFNKKHQIKELLTTDKLSFIDFWGLWCKPCIQQHGELKKLEDKLPNRFQIIALDYKDEKSNWTKFVKDSKSNWIHGKVGQKAILDLKIFKFPYNVLLDKNGELICEDCKIEEIETLIKSKESKK